MFKGKRDTVRVHECFVWTATKEVSRKQCARPTPWLTLYDQDAVDKFVQSQDSSEMPKSPFSMSRLVVKDLWLFLMCVLRTVFL